MKKRAIIYILIGTLLLILGLIFVYDNIISIAVLFIGAAGALIFPGFLMLSSNNKDERESKKIISQKPSASNGTLGFLLACIDLTITAIDEALEKKSKHAYKKNTSRLDYSIYWFFKSYYIICSAQNEALAEAFSTYFLDRLKEHYLPVLSESRIDNIIDTRLVEYQKIIHTSKTTKELSESLCCAIEQHIIKDLWFPDLASDDIAIAGSSNQLEVTFEIASMNDYIFTKVGKMYDELIIKWDNSI